MLFWFLAVMTSSMLILSEPDTHVLVEAKHVCTVAEGYWLSVEGSLRIDDEKKKIQTLPSYCQESMPEDQRSVVNKVRWLVMAGSTSRCTAIQCNHIYTYN